MIRWQVRFRDQSSRQLSKKRSPVYSVCLNSPVESLLLTVDIQLEDETVRGSLFLSATHAKNPCRIYSFDQNEPFTFFASTHDRSSKVPMFVYLFTALSTARIFPFFCFRRALSLSPSISSIQVTIDHSFCVSSTLSDANSSQSCFQITGGYFLYGNFVVLNRTDCDFERFDFSHWLNSSNRSRTQPREPSPNKANGCDIRTNQ